MTAAKIAPATKLPWQTNGAEVYGLDTSKLDVVRDVAKTETEQDAAYIVHAANAYPKLVEALKVAIATTPPDSAFLQSRVALLHELGEAK